MSSSRSEIITVTLSGEERDLLVREILGLDNDGLLHALPMLSLLYDRISFGRCVPDAERICILGPLAQRRTGLTSLQDRILNLADVITKES